MIVVILKQGKPIWLVKTYVLWNSAICLKLPKIKSLLSTTIFGGFVISIAFIYFSTTLFKSRPNSSSVSMSSRTIVLKVENRLNDYLIPLHRWTMFTVDENQHHQHVHRRLRFQIVVSPSLTQESIPPYSDSRRKFWPAIYIRKNDILIPIPKLI